MGKAKLPQGRDSAWRLSLGLNRLDLDGIMIDLCLVFRAEFSGKVSSKFDNSIYGSRSELRGQSETRGLKSNLLSSEPVVEFECLCMTEPR